MTIYGGVKPVIRLSPKKRDRLAEALEFTVDEHSPLAGKTLLELSLKDNVLLACINRHGKIIIPRGKDAVLPGDAVIAVTTMHGVKDVKEFIG